VLIRLFQILLWRRGVWTQGAADQSAKNWKDSPSSSPSE